MPGGIGLRKNMARSVRSKEHVNYVALDNLSSGDFEQVSTGKRNNKPGSKLYQVERLVSKRKSSAGDVGCNVAIKFVPVLQPFCLHLSEPSKSMHSGFNLKAAWLHGL